jgi:hypothetical protein
VENRFLWKGLWKTAGRLWIRTLNPALPGHAPGK